MCESIHENQGLVENNGDEIESSCAIVRHGSGREDRSKYLRVTDRQIFFCQQGDYYTRCDLFVPKMIVCQRRNRYAFANERMYV